MYAASAARAALGDQTVTGTIPGDLLTTDRVLQRWAVSVGSGLPTAVWDDAPVARPPPLPDDVAVIVDQIVLHAPRRKSLVIRLWYRTPAPTRIIARRLNVTPRGLNLEHSAALAFARLRFLAAGSRSLREMILDFAPLRFDFPAQLAQTSEQTRRPVSEARMAR